MVLSRSLLLFLLLASWSLVSTASAAAPAWHIAYGSDPRQFGELSLPDGPGPFPVVVLIHGGCWQASLPGPEAVAPLAADLQHDGVAVWSIDYRRLGDAGGGYPGTFRDTADGVDYLQQLAASEPLDLKRVVLVGHSAGGQLALWDTARGHLPRGSALIGQPRRSPLAVRGVVTLAGIDDLQAYHDSGIMACGGPDTIDRLIDSAQRADPYADTSPLALLPLGVPQIIVSGDADPVVPRRFGDAYVNAAVKAGDHAQAIDFQDADQFKLIDPASTNWARTKELIFVLLKQ